MTRQCNSPIKKERRFIVDMKQKLEIVDMKQKLEKNKRIRAYCQPKS